MLDNIINPAYGEYRFNNNIIDKQIYYGDTDTILVNVDIAEKLQKSGFVGINNGELTEDLNKNFNKDYIKNKDNYEFYKVIDYCPAAAKKYSMMYITPENELKTKIKINGINQDNCIHENSLTEKEETKITHESFKDMYLNTVNFKDTTEEDIKFLFKKDNKFIMPDRLRKINYNGTIKDINKNIPWFTIH